MYLFNHHVMIINSFFSSNFFRSLQRYFFGNLGFKLLNGKIKFPKTVKYKGGFCPTPLKMGGGGGLLPSSLIFKGGLVSYHLKKGGVMSGGLLSGGAFVCSLEFSGRPIFPDLV